MLLLTITLLIKRVTRFSNFRGRIPHEEGDIERLIDSYESARKFDSILLRLRADYSNIMYMRQFDAHRFTLEEAEQTFRVVENKSYVNLANTYASHNIFPESIAEGKIAELKQTDFNESNKRNYQLLTAQDFIEKHYEILNQIFAFFHRDRSSAECFNLEYIGEILSEPRDDPCWLVHIAIPVLDYCL